MGVTGFELGTDGPMRILVGYDGSPTSTRAGAYAAGLARRQGSRLVVVFVAAPNPLAAQLATTAAALAESQAELADQLRALAEEGAESVGVHIEFITRRGNPYYELIAVAAELHVDAVVVGASTHSNRRFVGSLAARLVRDATWPITVVP